MSRASVTRRGAAGLFVPLLLVLVALPALLYFWPDRGAEESQRGEHPYRLRGL